MSTYLNGIIIKGEVLKYVPTYTHCLEVIGQHVNPINIVLIVHNNNNMSSYI